MLLTPANLILIGFEQDDDNPNLYIRHDGQFEFNGSMAAMMKSFLSNDLTKEEADARSKSYLIWKAGIEDEIRKKLGL